MEALLPNSKVQATQRRLVGTGSATEDDTGHQERRGTRCVQFVPEPRSIYIIIQPSASYVPVA